MQQRVCLVGKLVVVTVLALTAARISSAQTGSASPGESETTSSYSADFFAGKNPQTAYDMVNLLPGFTFSAGDPTIRGYAAAAGNVVIDGERVTEKQFALDTVLQHIPADQVDHIDVIEAGKPGLEMLGQTVVANVIRRKTAGDKVVLTLSNAGFSNGRNTPGGSVEITRHWAGGRTFSAAFAASQYIELAEGDGPETTSNGDGNLIARTTVTSSAGGLNAYSYGTFSAPAWKGIVSINGSSSRTDYTYHERDDTVFPAPAANYLYEHLGGPLGGQLQTEAGAHFSRSLGERWTSESSTLCNATGQSYSSVLQGAGPDERFFEREHSGEALGRTNLRFSAGQSFTAEFSAEGAYNWLHTASLYAYEALPVPLPNAVANVQELRDQVSGNVIWQAQRSIQLELGSAIENSGITADADTHQSRTLNYFKPRAVVTFIPNTASHLRFRVEHEVSQLDFNNFVASSSLDTGSVRSGNASILPQQDWVLEALYEHHFWSEGDLVVSYRHLFLADVIDRVPIETIADPASVFDAPGNIGNGSEDAINASLTIPFGRFGAKNAQLKLTAVQQWSAVTDPTTGEIRPISGLNPLEYSATLYQDLPRWHANWGGSFLTPCTKSSTVKGCTENQYRFDEIDVYRATPAINLFAECRPWRGILLHIEGDNLLREHYDRIVTTYAGPRSEYPASSIDSRSLQSFPSILISLRKEF